MVWSAERVPTHPVELEGPLTTEVLTDREISSFAISCCLQIAESAASSAILNCYPPAGRFASRTPLRQPICSRVSKCCSRHRRSELRAFPLQTCSPASAGQQRLHARRIFERRAMPPHFDLLSSVPSRNTPCWGDRRALPSAPFRKPRLPTPHRDYRSRRRHRFYGGGATCFPLEGLRRNWS
jgi:hypothetical protein